eukprot:CAMPEP_0179072128 /NCGR_PEP_ID=MMETSP0796-20121207/31895_1 /TAXON_ID=73915 /ORGANISM="Pyrodinium bahamense, Strain pbaha01" /LENGTH=364 /DNA_ID=CAMNT_0020769279 /DNA_START=75 /DNA_END=1169 /DNA_ORIENTATION=-
MRWLLLLASVVLAMLQRSGSEVALDVRAVDDDQCSGSAGSDTSCAFSALQHHSSALEGTAPRRLAVLAEGSGGSQRVNSTAEVSGVQSRLKVVNGCSSAPIWIAKIAAGGIGPGPQDVKIAPGGSYDFATSSGPGAGLSATRFWPKMGCDEAGSNCAIGDSGGPGEACVIRGPGLPDDYSHCAPPVDSKFEATFAPPDAPDRDTVDMSLVDGYTLPFTLQVSTQCTRNGKPFQRMDCSDLSLAKCPTAEHLTAVDKTVDLRAVNPSTGNVAGCFSPCMRLVDDKWNTPVGPPDAPGVADYCCAGAKGTPDACKAGPVTSTQYLKRVHEMCPEAYGYAYDDITATIVCSTATMYTVTYYCPASQQ